MTASQRAVAYQLAAALRDALPGGTFDEAGFVARALSATDTAPDGDEASSAHEDLRPRRAS